MAKANKHEYSYASHHDVDDFPPDAYDYDDDVSSKGVDAMRERAKNAISAEEWVVVDGLGAHVPA